MNAGTTMAVPAIGAHVKPNSDVGKFILGFLSLFSFSSLLVALGTYL